jgi:hypothetical protein
MRGDPWLAWGIFYLGWRRICELGFTGARLQVGAVFGWRWCIGPTDAGSVAEEQEVKRVRKVDVFWMICYPGFKLRKSSSPVGCGFFREEWRGDRRLYHRCVWCLLIPSLGFCGAVVGHCLRGCCGCDFWSSMSGDGFVYVVVSFRVHACFHPKSCWNLEMTRSLVYQPLIQDTPIWGFLELVICYHLHHAREAGRFQNI